MVAAWTTTIPFGSNQFTRDMLLCGQVAPEHVAEEGCDGRDQPGNSKNWQAPGKQNSINGKEGSADEVTKVDKDAFLGQ